MTPRPHPAPDRAFRVVFALLAVATVVPLWIGRYLPLLDEPNHLAAIAVWHHYDDPAWDFARWYTLNIAPLPYWAHYYGVHLLAKLVSIETGNKLWLTAYAVALPTGALALARRFGRSPWVALFAFPLVWNFNIAEGFLAFSGGMTALVWGLVLVDWHAVRPTWRSALVVAFIANALYTFHLLPYMLFLVLGGLLCLTQRRAWNPILLAARGLPVVSGVALGIWAYRHEKKLGFLSITGKREFVFRSFEDTLHLVPGRLMNMLSSTRDEWVLVALVGGWLLLAVAAARGRKPGLEEGSVARALALPMCFAVTFAAVLLMPQTMHRPFYWYMINLRFVPLAALFAALLLRGSFDGWRRWLFAPVAAASLFYAVDLARGVWMFNQRVDGFDAVVEQIPRRARVLTLSLRPLVDPDFNVGVYNQWPAYVQLRRGGYNFYNFAQGFPLKYKTLLPAPPWDHAELFNYDSQGYAWEYFLVHHEGREADPLKNARDAHQIELVAARGDWKLYKNLHPRF